MRSPTPEKHDPLLILARAASAGGRRRRPLLVTLIGLALLVGLVAVIGWWVWPGPDEPPLVLFASDRVAFPEEEVSLVAQFETVTETSADPKWAGLNVLFEERETGLHTKVASDANGEARLNWRASVPAPRTIEIAIRWAGDGNRRSATAVQRIFIWPADSTVVVVDADHSLLNDPEASPRPGNATARQLMPGAFDALQQMAKKHRIVYLTAEVGSPRAYSQLAAWLQQVRADDGQQLPNGPLLGPSPDGLSVEFGSPGRRPRMLAYLKDRFRAGKVYGIFRRTDEEPQFKEAGLTRIVRVGTREEKDEDAVPWADVAKRLE